MKKNIRWNIVAGVITTILAMLILGLSVNTLSVLFPINFSYTLSQVITVLASIMGLLVSFFVASQERSARNRTSGNNYQDRIKSLTDKLAQASTEVDNVLKEIASVTQQREEKLKNLEFQLGELSQREKEMKNRIDTLKNIPIEAVDHFVQELEKGDKRSASRDYFLFGAGIIASIIITIMLKSFFGI